MLDRADWLEPILEWRHDIDADALQERLSRDGEFLGVLAAQPSETVPTHWYRLTHEYWIAQRGVGAVQFTLHEPRLTAFASKDVEPGWFFQVVTRAWLPIIYPYWNRQVIHASAVVRPDSLSAVALTGQTLAGKSTTAYGVARRPGWRLLTDDTFGFSFAAGVGSDALALYPLKNEARLRPASAEYFGRSGQPFEPVIWPDGKVRLAGIYVLEGSEDGPLEPEFTRLRMAEAFPLLLQQAYALSFDLPKYNQQLMKDYGQLAAVVPVFRLRYRRSFEVAEALFEALDTHITRELVS